MLAIHRQEGSFSEKWIAYCDSHNIEYKVVDCFATDIVDQIGGCSGLMWHWLHYDSAAANFARQLTLSLEHAGVKVFPDTRTAWHYDDKLGQKYLLEAAKLPYVPTYAFYDKEAALTWARNTDYPKVFKLRRGAGSMNVSLVHSYRKASQLIHRGFGAGWKDRSSSYIIRERLWHLKRDRTALSLLKLGHGLTVGLLKTLGSKRPVEQGYVYFQDFVPGNDSDIRVNVLGSRAFAVRRMVREGDFRASGSGHLVHDPAQIPIESIKAAFSASRNLKSQCLAFDFIFEDDQPLIVEMSYSFPPKIYLDCPGYWDRDLNWIEGKFTPHLFMIEDFLTECRAT